MITIDSIIKGGKRAVAGILVASMLYGCGQPSDGGGKPTPTNTAPVFGADNCPTQVYENTSGECQLNVTDAENNPITYSTLDTSGYITVNSATGKVNWNVPQVSEDTIYSTTMKACDDKNACSEKNWETEIKNVIAGENAKPLINSVDIYSPASFDGNNILVTWGKSFGNKINATDLEGDVINYDVDVTGDNLSVYQLTENFTINTTKPTSTDATHDLGQLVIDACDAGGCDTKTLPLVGKNPIQQTANLKYNENGTYKIISDATSDVSYLDRAEPWINGVHESLADKSFGDVYTGYADWDVLIVDGENESAVKYFNKAGDERDVVQKWSPATESEWRTIMRERLANWGFVQGVDYVEDSTNYFTANNDSQCPAQFRGQNIGIRSDFTLLYNGQFSTFNNTTFSDDLVTDVANQDALEYCGSGITPLRLARPPAYEIYNRIDEFHHLGFTFE